MHTAKSYIEKTHTAKAFHALAGRAFFRALDCEFKVSYPTGTVTSTIPNALTGNNQPKTKPNGVNPARRLLITTDANGRAAVWFTLGKQSGEAGNMVQVSASDANSNSASNPTTASGRTDIEISEAVVFTATGDRGVPAKILAEGGGAQYAETGGQPLDALTAVTYDGEVNPVPGAIIAYVIEQDGGVDLDDGAKFTTSSASSAVAISNNRKVLITTADNNGRSAARPTMGTATGTVRISTYAMPPLTPNATVRPELVEGLANAGNGTNNALTTTPGLVGLATFQIAVLPQSDGPTQFTGKILDHTGKPLQGVRVTVSRTPLSVTTDAAGNFSFLQDVPQGKLDLFVDGRAVTGTTPLPGGQTTPTQYPSLHFEVLAIRGQKNILPHPIYLPPLLMSQAKIVGGNEDVSLTIPGRDGFEMIVKANSVTFPDGTRIGPLVVSPVADDRLPMSPPGGGSSFMPGAAATIQPSGTRFDPPIEVRLPNTSGYAPGERVVIYHWDHDIGQYVAMGQATVTDDGAQLITDPGSGITKAGWHGPPTPPPCVDTGTTGTCAECQKVESVGGGGRCPAVKICMKDYDKDGVQCAGNVCKECKSGVCSPVLNEKPCGQCQACRDGKCGSPFLDTGAVNSPFTPEVTVQKCQEIKALIESDDQNGWLGTMSDPRFIPLVGGAVGLNISVPTTVGQVDLDWMLVTNLGGLSGLPLCPVGIVGYQCQEIYNKLVYRGAAHLWQGIKAFAAVLGLPTGLDPTTAQDIINRQPSATLAAQWARGAKLRNLLAPTINGGCACAF